MYTINRITVTFFLLQLYTYAFTQVNAPSTHVIVKLIPVFNNQKLILNDKDYLTKQNDTIRITLFKMYLGNFRFISDEKSNSNMPAEYFLIDSEDTATFTLHFNTILSSRVNQLELLIGVDSLTNVSGALDGDLDPIKGMFWAWNTGYVSAKMEGNFKRNNGTTKKFEFHIGGYQKPFESSRKILIPFPETSIKPNEVLYMEFYLDLAEWFIGKTSIQLAQVNSVVHPCNISYQLADNYSKMIKYKNSKIIK